MAALCMDCAGFEDGDGAFEVFSGKLFLGGLKDNGGSLGAFLVFLFGAGALKEIGDFRSFTAVERGGFERGDGLVVLAGIDGGLGVLEVLGAEAFEVAFLS